MTEYLDIWDPFTTNVEYFIIQLDYFFLNSKIKQNLWTKYFFQTISQFPPGIKLSLWTGIKIIIQILKK